ncbi:MAG: hypothetical protein J5855_04130 [Mailhella sp.]|nr:hypothetical protein [Mailhella sp.]
MTQLTERPVWVTPSARSDAKIWLLLLIVFVLTLAVLSINMLRLRNEKTTLNYEIYKIQQEITATNKLIDKLEVERDRFLSPYILNKQAQRLGLDIAGPGQVRRLPAPKPQ